MVQAFLDGNQKFVAGEFSARRDYYEGLASGQSPTLLWIGCSDSRVSESAITDSLPGSIFVHRNVGNIVAFNDLNFAAILEYAVRHLKIRDVVVCGHYDCGGMQALLDGVEENYIADWLLIAQGALNKVAAEAEARGLDHKQKLDLLAEENVRLQISHLRSFALIKSLLRRGEAPRLHGWMYSFQSGQIKVLVDGR